MDRLAELEWIRRSRFFSFTGSMLPKRAGSAEEVTAQGHGGVLRRSSLRQRSQSKPAVRAITARGFSNR